MRKIHSFRSATMRKTLHCTDLEPRTTFKKGYIFAARTYESKFNIISTKQRTYEYEMTRRSPHRGESALKSESCYCVSLDEKKECYPDDSDVRDVNKKLR